MLDLFKVLNLRESNLKRSVERLEFVAILAGRDSPAALFNPLDAKIRALYGGEDERIQALLSCSLQTRFWEGPLLEPQL